MSAIVEDVLIFLEPVENDEMMVMYRSNANAVNVVIELMP